MSEGKNHSEELMRYLNSEMSHREAHEFEKKALSDPFLQDALEGAEVMEANLFNKDLTDIKDHILPSRSKKGIWRIAAVVSLVILSISSIWVIRELDDQAQVAQTYDTEKNSPSPEKELEKDSLYEVAESKEMPTSKEEPIITLDEELSQPIAQSLEEEKPQVIEPLQEEEGVLMEDIDQFEMAEEMIAEAAPDDNAPMLETEESQDIQPSAQAKRSSSKSFISTHREQLDTSVQSGASSFQESEAPLELQESMATGFADSENVEDGNKGASPEPDFKTFEKYLEENLSYPEEAINNGITGTVILQLTIFPNGTISEIKVKRSLGFGCDEEAIRLIEDGPKWQSALKAGQHMESKIRVKVKFELD